MFAPQGCGRGHATSCLVWAAGALARNPRHVKAAVYRETGDASTVLSVEEIETPEPGPAEVRVRIATPGSPGSPDSSGMSVMGLARLALSEVRPGVELADRRRTRNYTTLLRSAALGGTAACAASASYPTRSVWKSGVDRSERRSWRGRSRCSTVSTRRSWRRVFE